MGFCQRVVHVNVFEHSLVERAYGLWDFRFVGRACLVHCFFHFVFVGLAYFSSIF